MTIHPIPLTIEEDYVFSDEAYLSATAARLAALYGQRLQEAVLDPDSVQILDPPVWSVSLL